jgi:hypothetical protein
LKNNSDSGEEIIAISRNKSYFLKKEVFVTRGGRGLKRPLTGTAREDPIINLYLLRRIG